MWSEIWSTFVYSKLVSSYVPTSYLTGDWKWFNKNIANSPKVEYHEWSSLMYHFATLPIRVRWNRFNCIESLCNVFDEHNRWKVVMWSPGSSQVLPSNFIMSEGNLVGMGGQRRSWKIGSFNNLDKYRKCNFTRNGSFGWVLCTGKREPRVWLAPGFQEKLGCWPGF
jgi:hypothetical protein